MNTCDKRKPACDSQLDCHIKVSVNVQNKSMTDHSIFTISILISNLVKQEISSQAYSTSSRGERHICMPFRINVAGRASLHNTQQHQQLTLLVWSPNPWSVCEARPLPSSCGKIPPCSLLDTGPHTAAGQSLACRGLFQPAAYSGCNGIETVPEPEWEGSEWRTFAAACPCQRWQSPDCHEGGCDLALGQGMLQSPTRWQMAACCWRLPCDSGR